MKKLLIILAVIIAGCATNKNATRPIICGISEQIDTLGSAGMVRSMGSEFKLAKKQ
jgi:hypothetical protein